jgi:hypothetical protein
MPGRKTDLTAYQYCKKYSIVYSTFQRWDLKLKSDFIRPVAIKLPEEKDTSGSIIIETRNLKITLPDKTSDSTLAVILKELSRCS